MTAPQSPALPSRREVRTRERAAARAGRRRAVSTLVVAAALTGVTGSLVPATAAPATPQSRYAAPAPVEALNPYVGQVACDPTVKPGTKALADLLVSTYGTGSTGTVRSCSSGGRSEHKDGRAIDWMLNASNPAQKAVADAFLAWLVADGPDGAPGYQARRLGVMYVIWNRQTWATYRPQWQPYTGASPHTDHIHISLGWNGAMARTSWWTGRVAPVEYGPCVAVDGQVASYPAPNYTRCAAPAPPTPAPAPAPVTASPTAPTARYTVVSGDTLYRIAARFGTTVTALRSANGLTGDTIRVGQVLTIPGAGALPARFTDVPASHPYYTEIQWLAARGITNGVGDGTRFSTAADVQRLEMAGFLHRLSGDTGYVPPRRATFSDVRASWSLYGSVEWLVARGVTQGVGGARFDPHGSVERQQMAAFLFRMAGDSRYRAPARSRFADVSTSHPFYREISWLADQGISQGVGGSRFDPRSHVSRQHMAAFLHRYAQARG